MAFPSNASVIWQPLGSSGSLGMVPRLHCYYWLLRLPAVPPAFLRCLRSAVPPSHPVVRFWAGRCPPFRPGLFGLWLPQPRFQAETTGPPRFLGDPLWTCPALRPRRDLRTRPLRSSGAAFRNTEIVGSRNQQTFEAQSRGLSTHCLRFAGWVAPPPHKTRFWLLVRLCQAGFVPAGFQRKVSEFKSLPPFQSLPDARTSLISTV